MPIAARPLDERDLDPDPFVQFQRWYDDAVAHGEVQPDAMIVATSTPDARPSARAVLLRGIDDRGICFFTNLDSRKGHEIDANPHAAIVFHWPTVLRQVRATGDVERVSDPEADAYWNARPRASRISALASSQSQPIANRGELEAHVAEIEARVGDGDPERPAGWGGYRVAPHEFEFWQHRDDRLHDRLVYTRFEGAWRVTRLQP